MRRRHNIANPGDPLFACPSCGFSDFKILESRVVDLGRRRRYHCHHCGHRETTYEISQTDLDRLRLADRLYRYAAKIVKSADPEPPAEGPACDQCIHFSNERCTMGIPEAGDGFAAECSIFSSHQ